MQDRLCGSQELIALHFEEFHLKASGSGFLLREHPSSVEKCVHRALHISEFIGFAYRQSSLIGSMNQNVQNFLKNATLLVHDPCWNQSVGHKMPMTDSLFKQSTTAAIIDPIPFIQSL